jgi:hypothetical protein
LFATSRVRLRLNFGDVARAGLLKEGLLARQSVRMKPAARVEKERILAAAFSVSTEFFVATDREWPRRS